MILNQKLTHLVAGRTVTASTEIAARALTITFSDGSTLHLTLATENIQTLHTGTLHSISQNNNSVKFIFANQTETILTIDPDASTIMLRSPSGSLQYIG